MSPRTNRKAAGKRKAPSIRKQNRPKTRFFKLQSVSLAILIALHLLSLVMGTVYHCFSVFGQWIGWIHEDSWQPYPDSIVYLIFYLVCGYGGWICLFWGVYGRKSVFHHLIHHPSARYFRYDASLNQVLYVWIHLASQLIFISFLGYGLMCHVAFYPYKDELYHNGVAYYLATSLNGFSIAVSVCMFPFVWSFLKSREKSLRRIQ